MNNEVDEDDSESEKHSDNEEMKPEDQVNEKNESSYEK